MSLYKSILAAICWMGAPAYPVTGKEKKRKDYAFWRQFIEKPMGSVIPGCPVPVTISASQPLDDVHHDQ